MKKSILTHLDSAQSAISEMLDTCLTSRKVSNLKVSLNSTQAVLSATLDHLQTHPRVLSKTKKSISAIRNTLQGLQDGLESRDLSLKEFRSICSNIRSKFVPQLESSVLDESIKAPKDSDDQDGEASAEFLPEQLQDLKEAATVAIGASMKEMLQVVRKQLAVVDNRAGNTPTQAPVDEDEEDGSAEGPKTSRQRYEDREKSEAEKHLKTLKVKRDNLPVTLKSHGDKAHAFTVVRLPLVPLFEQWTMTQEALLKRLNIPFLKLGGYAIFEEQIILVISKAAAQAVNKDFKKTALKLDPKTGRMEIPGKRMLDITREAVPIVDYAKVILDIINEQSSGSTYSLVSDQFVANPRNADLLCFWVMGTAKVSALIKAAGFGSARIKQWGFPWDR